MLILFHGPKVVLGEFIGGFFAEYSTILVVFMRDDLFPLVFVCFGILGGYICGFRGASGKEMLLESVGNL